jgi:hypothetical protein
MCDLRLVENKGSRSEDVATIDDDRRGTSVVHGEVAERSFHPPENVGAALAGLGRREQGLLDRKDPTSVHGSRRSFSGRDRWTGLQREREHEPVDRHIADALEELATQVPKDDGGRQCSPG